MYTPPEYPPVEKPKNRPRRRGCSTLWSSWGCALLTLLVFGVLVLGVAAYIFFGPDLFLLPNYAATKDALEQTALFNQQRALDNQNTQAALDIQAAMLDQTALFNQQRALDNQRTRAALNSQAVLLDQTATQSERGIVATQTAQAFSNEQQQTQSAQDYIETQAALDRQATEVYLDYMATQSALDQQATAMALPAEQSEEIATPQPRE